MLFFQRYNRVLDTLVEEEVSSAHAEGTLIRPVLAHDNCELECRMNLLRNGVNIFDMEDTEFAEWSPAWGWCENCPAVATCVLG